MKNISVNGFPTLDEEEFANKENFNDNIKLGERNRISKVKKLRAYFDSEKDQILNQSRYMKESLLPQIKEKIGVKYSDSSSRGKAKFFDKNRKKMPTIIIANREERGMGLR